MKKKQILSFILLMLCSVSFLSAQQLQQDPDLVKGQLKNGCTYYIYPNKKLQGEAIFRLYVKAGSVYEQEEQRGLAHFLEHMAFNGTDHFKDNELVDFLASKGAKFGKDLNAHTSYGETVYKLQLPTSDINFVDSTLTILSDWAGGFLLDSAQIEKERGVIFSEWRSKQGPKNEASNSFLDELLNGSRFSKRKVIGDTAVILHCPQEKLRSFYRSWYRPDLMAVAVAGDVNPRKVKRMIKKKFKSLHTSVKGEIKNYEIDDFSEPKLTNVTHESFTKIELNILQLIPAFTGIDTEEDFKVYLKRVFLNKLMKARFRELAVLYPPYSKPSCSVGNFLDAKGVVMSSVVLKSQEIDEGIKAFYSQLERMYRFGFTNLEIEKVKKIYLTSIQRRAASSSSLNNKSLIADIKSDFYSHNTMVNVAHEKYLVDKYISLIDSTNMLDYLNSIHDSQKCHYLINAPEKDKKVLPSQEKLFKMLNDVHKSVLKPYGKDIVVPKSLLNEEPVAGTIVKEESLDQMQAKSFILSNGAKVIFKHSTIDKDRISISGFRTGGLYSMDSTDYVNGIFAGPLVALSGVGDFSREALSLFLAGNTASVRFLMDKTRSGLAGSSSQKDRETLFRLLSLKWNAPRIDSAVFKRVKRKLIKDIQTKNETASNRFYEQVKYLVQGSNYTNRKITDSIIEKELKMDRILPTYQHCFGSAKGFTFIIISDVPLEKVKPLMLKYIGGLPSGDTKTNYLFHGSSVFNKAIDYQKHVGDSPKAVVSLIFQRPELDGDLRGLGLQNQFMKELVRMRLLKKLREEMGCVYSVGVSAGISKHPSSLSRQNIQFNCAPSNVDSLINITMEQLRIIVANPASLQREVENIKTNLIKDYHAKKQQNLFWSRSIRNTIYNQDPDWDYVVDFEEKVNTISCDQISDLIKKSFLKTPMIKTVLYPKENVSNNQ